MVETLKRKFKCYIGGHDLEIPYGTGRPEKCPNCGNTNIYRSPADRGHARAGMGHRGGP